MTSGGPRVLLIHSTGTLPDMWTRLLAAVPLAWPTLTPANLGYPPLPPLTRSTAFHWSQDVERLRTAAAGASELHLVGHSYGGMLALRLAHALAQDGGPRVASMWLYEPVLFGALRREQATLTGPAREQMTWLFEHSGLLESRDGLGDEDWLRSFIDFWNRPGAWDAMPEAARAAMRPLGWKMAQEVRAINLDPAGFEDFHVEAPLTLLSGTRTKPTVQALIQRLAEVNPQATVTTLDGLSHMAPLTRPDALAPAFRAHFAALGAISST